jgi:hypothetical protein
MAWWYKIRDASGKLMETRRGFSTSKEAQHAGEIAVRTIQEITPGRILRLMIGEEECPPAG